MHDQPPVDIDPQKLKILTSIRQLITVRLCHKIDVTSAIATRNLFG